MHGRTPAAPKNSSATLSAAGKKRGSYNCGRCGLPKKGHVCHFPGPSSATPTSSDVVAATPPRQLTPENRRRPRALSFDEGMQDAEEEVVLPAGGEGEVIRVMEDEVEDEEDDEVVVVGGDGTLNGACLVEVLRRLPPKGLMAAAAVCKAWNGCIRRVWKLAEELRLRVPPRSQIGFVGSVLQKCSGLVRLTLRMESDVDATLLACIAFSCTNLETLEICTADTAVNRISGDELSRFVAEKRCLSSLKIEGCTNLGSLNLCSLSLSILWLSDLYCISKSVINCPSLKELSVHFSRQDNDSTDLAMMVDSLGRTCPHLQNLHIASSRLSNAAVLALAGSKLRGLRMLSLVLGSKITDASVAAIVQSYTELELLDLSGSSISDSGIGMICNVLPDTLSRLLLALCPNVTSSGIQFATAQLPLLQLIDCGMSMCDISKNENPDGSKERINARPQAMYQKLIIKHGQLKKLSLWGCSGLDALYLNCPELNDLNLNSCTNLHPERLLLQCPNLEKIHASGCEDVLTGAIQSQVFNEFAAGETRIPCKRLADGSKRIQVPNFLLQQPSDDEKQKRIRRVRCTLHC